MTTDTPPPTVAARAPRRARRLLGILPLAAALLAAGCGSGGSNSSSTASSTSSGTGAAAGSGSKHLTVYYQNIEIVPAMLTIEVGTTVKWISRDDVDHNVTSESGPAKFSSPNFGNGGTFTYTFNTPGVVNYECSIHPTTMQGAITVVK